MLSAHLEEVMDQQPKRVLYTELAEAAGVKQSTLSQFRRGAELGFLTLVKVWQKLLPLTAFKEIPKACVHMKRPSNVRFALEYLAMSRRFDLVDIFLEQIERFGNPELKELAKVYRMQKMWQENQTSDSFLFDLREMRFATPTARALQIILEMSYFNELGKIDSMAMLIPRARQLVQKIKISEVRKLYESRIEEIQAHAALFYDGKVDDARELAEMAVSGMPFTTPTLLANHCYRMGMSYMYDNPSRCLDYLNKAVEHLELEGREDRAKEIIDNEIAFVKIKWGLVEEPEKLEEPSARAFYEALYGDKQEALRIIDTLKGGAFTYYYRGLATGDSTYMVSALAMFLSNGNRFYARLAYEELRKDPALREVASIIYQKEC